MLELTRSGLTSPDTTTVVGDQTGAIQAVENLINVRVPQMAGMNSVDVRGRRTFVLSDPPDNPLSYQGLSLGMYARAIHLLGRRASPAARETLKEVAQASWWLTAPDGDLGWYGRSQEESWGVAATAYGAAAAANLPDMVGRRALAMRALTERALNRLKSAYGTGPRGLYITPAVRKALSLPRRRDGNAGGPSFTGITLMMLNWLQPELRTNPRVGAQIGADRNGGVQLSVRDARIAVVRRGNVWFGLRMMPSTNRPDDLRYDFGIQVAKLRRGGQWIDLMPVRPNTGVPLSDLRPPSPDSSTDATGQSPGSRYAPTDTASGSGSATASPEATTAARATSRRPSSRPARPTRPARSSCCPTAARPCPTATRCRSARTAPSRSRRVAHRRGGHRAQRGDLRVRADRQRDPHDLPAPGRRRDPVLGLLPGHGQARPPPARDHRPGESIVSWSGRAGSTYARGTPRPSIPT